MGGRDASQEMGLEDQWALVSPHLELREQEGQIVGSVRKKCVAKEKIPRERGRKGPKGTNR